MRIFDRCRGSIEERGQNSMHGIMPEKMRFMPVTNVSILLMNQRYRVINDPGQKMTLSEQGTRLISNR